MTGEAMSRIYEIQPGPIKSLGRVGLIGRFKPLHKGGQCMLESVCSSADYVVIGIGSSNKYNVRNPFTPEESKDMIDAVLSPKYSNYSVVFVPDFAHIPEYSDGQRWMQYICEKFGNLDHFVTGNDYVGELLGKNYDLVHPAKVIPKERWLYMKATQVRLAIAQGGNWQSMVPDQVAEYIQENKLDERFRREFGLQTLVELASRPDYLIGESREAERQHTMET